MSAFSNIMAISKVGRDTLGAPGIRNGAPSGHGCPKTISGAIISDQSCGYGFY
jgi:hypothetical protein